MTLPLSAVELVLHVARATVGAGEVGGPNAGPFVERCQKITGNKPPDPWCASFVAMVGVEALGADWPVPKTASCTALGEWAKAQGALYTSPLVGDIFLLHFASLGRFAHTGFILTASDLPRTIEGNTNVDGSREGWLVAERTRRFGLNDRFVRWTKVLTP